MIAYSGIKFFYSHTTPRDWPTLQRLRVRKEKRLPDVLSVDEVRRLIDAVRTPHNRAYFWTVYSLGLRLEEGLHLQVGDIDSARMMVHVHRGKGAKDRYVPLPSRTLTILRQYWVTHRHPIWLFPATGRDRPARPRRPTRPMDRSSVQGAMSRVVQELEFQKAISIHTLRHSYATHLLEAGVNLRLIQQYLGHSSLQTTMVYLHLTTASQEQAVARIETLDGALTDADRRRRAAAVRRGVSRAVRRDHARGAQEGAPRDHRVPHRRVGDRALRVRIVRPDPRDGPVLRQPALPDVPAGQDPRPGSRSRSIACCRAPTSWSPSRCRRSCAPWLAVTSAWSTPRCSRPPARRCAPWQRTRSSSARIASASSASCTPGAGRWSITRTCTTWCRAAASAPTARAGCRRGPTSSCRSRPCRSSSGPSSGISSSARAC